MAGYKNVISDIEVLRERVADKSNSPGSGGGGVVVVVDIMSGGVGGEGSIVFAVKMSFLYACNIMFVSYM